MLNLLINSRVIVMDYLRLYPVTDYSINKLLTSQRMCVTDCQSDYNIGANSGWQIIV